MAKPTAAILMLLIALPAPFVAADAPTHGDLPMTFSVAEPKVGDAGAYTRSVVLFEDGAVTTLEGPLQRESFRIEAPHDHYDADGVPHRVNTLHAWIPSMGADMRSYVDATTGRLVATQYLEEGADYYTNETNFPGRYGLEPMCGLQNALQHGDVPLGLSLRLFESDCRRAHYAFHPGEGRFVATRSDPWGDGTAVGFQQEGTPLVVMAWFTPGIPYPVRLLDQIDDGPSPRFAMLDLTAFSRGDGSVAAPGELPVLQPLSPVRLVPHHGIGADESGIDHPFPWSEAWQVAQSNGKVQEFLADHRDAVVRQAVYNEFTYDGAGSVPAARQGSHTHAWFATLDDGRAAFKFAVQRTTSQQSVEVPVAGRVPLPPESEDSVEVEGEVPSYPMVERAPALLPDVASATAWWQAYATPHFQAYGPNGWFHNLACDCAKPWAGNAAGYLKGDVLDGHWHWEASFLSIDSNGRATMLLENIYDAEFGAPQGLANPLHASITTPLPSILEEALEDASVLQEVAAPPPLPVGVTGPGPNGGEAAPGPAPASRAVANEPVETSAAVAPIVLAATAGAIGVAWLGKIAVAALFSRLRRDRALDHPVRRAIMEAVELDPGIHLAALATRTGRGAGVLRHHLAKLAEAGLVTSRKGGGYLCYFPGEAATGNLAAAPALKADGARRVLRVLSEGSAGIRPIATKAGLAPSTVEHHLARLSAAGLVERENGAFRVTEAGRAAA